MSSKTYRIKTYQRCLRTGTRVIIETDVDAETLQVVEPVHVTLSGPETLELELVSEGREYPK
jgi:hypothetical protein